MNKVIEPNILIKSDLTNREQHQQKVTKKKSPHQDAKDNTPLLLT